ncbi:hypothetical protein G718_04963 [Escherichia coli HVH 43 (4-2173468)]|uniref:hypothetical protein n=1 Tax=Escherichia coli TaxID=562 RepID=UPI00038F3BB0|nr:hypothetical protein [Escherichia coli]EQO56142.1 hypothetical protein G718_04963 [Escherichia coli HVH 43 (4-2173468)]
MTTEQGQPFGFKVEHLYSMLRAYCLSVAPYPLEDITVPAVANAFMTENTPISGKRFNMSGDVPPDFTGQLVDAFGPYLEHDESRWPAAGSDAWFTIQFMRLKTADDLNKLGDSLDAMAKWMVATGYLTGDSTDGYLPTPKLLEERTLKF